MATSIRHLLAGVTVAALAVMLSFSVAPAQDKKSKDTPPAKTADAGKGGIEFEVYKGKDGFRFRIKDSDGDILAVTQKGYDKKEDLMKVIDVIKQGAAKAKLDDQSTKK
jgi:uncharacterized protein YegP (UPF0339 family)